MHTAQNRNGRNASQSDERAPGIRAPGLPSTSHAQPQQTRTRVVDPSSSTHVHQLYGTGQVVQQDHSQGPRFRDTTQSSEVQGSLKAGNHPRPLVNNSADSRDRGGTLSRDVKLDAAITLTTKTTSRQPLEPSPSGNENLRPKRQIRKEKVNNKLVPPPEPSKWCEIWQYLRLPIVPVIWVWFNVFIKPCRYARNRPVRSGVYFVLIMVFWPLLVDVFWLSFCRASIATFASASCRQPYDPSAIKAALCKVPIAEPILLAHGIACPEPERSLIETTNHALNMSEPLKTLLVFSYDWRNIDFHMNDIALVIRLTDIPHKESLATQYTECGKELKSIHGLLMEHLDNIHLFLTTTRRNLGRLIKDLEALQGASGILFGLLTNHAAETQETLTKHLDWVDQMSRDLLDESNEVTNKIYALEVIWLELNLQHGKELSAAEKRAHKEPSYWRRWLGRPTTHEEDSGDRDRDTLEHIYHVHFPSVQGGLAEARSWLEQTLRVTQRARKWLAPTRHTTGNAVRFVTSNLIEELNDVRNLLAETTLDIEITWTMIQRNAKQPDYFVPTQDLVRGAAIKGERRRAVSVRTATIAN